jgi:hypothetical protein
MPPQIAPYHLRLDWLMWFAALSSYEEQPWFEPFMRKLLEGDRPVLSLLRTNPFPDRPPRYVRALLYEYHFTAPAERAATGRWWSRKLVGNYFPAIVGQTSRSARVLQDPLLARMPAKLPAWTPAAGLESCPTLYALR